MTMDQITPLVPVDVEAELKVVTKYFAGHAAQETARALESELTSADLLVCDELDFGAMAAADRAGVPVVVVAVIVSGALVRPSRIEKALVKLRDEFGLHGPTRPRGDVFVIPFAPAMHDPEFPPPQDALWMRPETKLSPAPDGSIVVTLGTEFNSESGDLFPRILDAVVSLDAPTVVAIGRDLDPARFGRQPPHVRVEQYIDLSILVPRASVVLHHGGSGMFLSTVLGGAPQLVFPMGADQPFTAMRVVELGLGGALDPLATPAEIRSAIVRLRGDAVMRKRIATLREETLALPEPASLVRSLESLARRRD
jgi:hypothetical protein